MARLTLDFPEELFCFSTSLSVRVTDINGANHLANDALISMISEARARFLHAYAIAEVNPQGIGIIVTDLATVYRAEAYARDQLLFEVGMMDLNKYGADIIFRISRPADGTLIALAKSGLVFYDYTQSRVSPWPEALQQRFSQADRLA